jgi:hypothetical protein
MWLRGRLGEGLAVGMEGGVLEPFFITEMPLSLWIVLCFTQPPFSYYGNYVFVSSSFCYHLPRGWQLTVLRNVTTASACNTAIPREAELQ